MTNKMEQFDDLIAEMVRDFTVVMPRPKSDVRRRIHELKDLAYQKGREEERKRIVEMVLKYKCGGHKKLLKDLTSQNQ